MTHAIMILNDGETWTEVHKCELCVLTDEEFEKVADGELTLDEINPLADIEFENLLATLR